MKWLTILFCMFIANSEAWGWSPRQATLMTQWAADVSPTNALPEYPRPQMVRSSWQNLNGLWDYAITPTGAGQPSQWDGQILVPFPVQSALSGVMQSVNQNQEIWYHTSFTLPSAWPAGRVLLHFGAVCWQSTVWVNGRPAGNHTGSYDGFTCDITPLLQSGANSLVVMAWNPADTQGDVHGKQSLYPQGIFYTASTGIWQTVWLEPVPENSISRLKMVPDVDHGLLRLTVTAAGTGGTVRATASADGVQVAGASGPSGAEIDLPIPNPRLWSPSSPFLYDLKVTLQQGGRDVDSVASYFGMRKVSTGPDSEGILRPLLNNQFFFQTGLLDQGYWPDGVYTAPTDAALKYDIQVMKQFGFPVDRKHMKVEPERWYYWCDVLGLMVYQDMPSGATPNVPTEAEQAQFRAELQAMVDGRGNHPCITQWTLFNEGWMQDTSDNNSKTAQLAQWLRAYDPTRIIDDASGGVQSGEGDCIDIHDYIGPSSPQPDSSRFAALGEFGGLGFIVPGHSYPSPFCYLELPGQRLFEWAFLNLFQQAWQLVPGSGQTGLVESAGSGLSSAIYTQLTDVESESNGLLTYDRAVFRINPTWVADMNRGVNDFPPVTTLVPPQAQGWKYTTTQPPADWASPGFDDSSWSTGRAGFGTWVPNALPKTGWGPCNGCDIWLRRQFTSGQAGVSPWVYMYHDEDAEVYLNGAPAASASGYAVHYLPFPVSPAAAALLQPGTNTMAVHCRQTSGGQFIDAALYDYPPPYQPPLRLAEYTSCSNNQAQAFFSVTGDAPVTLSDITLKYWVYDTTGADLVPNVYYGGCLTNPSCFHAVSGVSASAVRLSPSCGSGSSRANWEITVSNTDSTLLGAGVSWVGAQVAVHLSDYRLFAPGAGSWYSPCVGGSYTANPNYAVYVRGNLVAGNPPCVRSAPTPAVAGDQAAVVPVENPTATPTPSPEHRSGVVAAPNISRNGEPIQFRVDLDQPSKLTLAVFTLTGEQVYQASLEGSTGTNRFTWDLRGPEGSDIASGLYLYSIEISGPGGTSRKTGKVAVVH